MIIKGLGTSNTILVTGLSFIAFTITLSSFTTIALRSKLNQFIEIPLRWMLKTICLIIHRIGPTLDLCSHVGIHSCHGSSRNETELGKRTFSRHVGTLHSSCNDDCIDCKISCNVPQLRWSRSEEHTSELQSHHDLVC